MYDHCSSSARRCCPNDRAFSWISELSDEGMTMPPERIIVETDCNALSDALTLGTRSRLVVRA